jgi:hypothetical protein
MARFPTPSGDYGAWDDLINELLRVTLEEDGTWKNIKFGTGSPEGVVTATVGKVFLRTDGSPGVTMYIKETGSGNTGWQAVSTAIQVNTQTGTAYTLVLSDAGKVVEMNNAAANVLTVPNNSAVPYPIGTIIEPCQYGAGQTTIAEAAGVVINAPNGKKLVARYSSASLRKRATNEWMLIGDTTP